MKSVKNQLMERGVPAEEVVSYTQRWGGFNASQHYGFGYLSFGKFYFEETGSHLPPGKLNSSTGKTVGEQLLEAVLSRVSSLQVENERLTGEVAEYRRLIELKTDKQNEQEILVADQILALCKA